MHNRSLSSRSSNLYSRNGISNMRNHRLFNRSNTRNPKRYSLNNNLYSHNSKKLNRSVYSSNARSSALNHTIIIALRPNRHKKIKNNNVPLKALQKLQGFF